MQAAAVNNRDRAGRFRHPVHGSGHLTRQDWTWVSQEARPSFLTRAIPAAINAERDITEAMDRAARRLGFH